MDIYIIAADSVMVRTAKLYTVIMQAPYPSPAIITNLVQQHFPELSQEHALKLTKNIERSITDSQKVAAVQQYIKQHSASLN